MSIKSEYANELFNYYKVMASFAPERHLKEREELYVHGINDAIKIVRETEEGWWRESLDFKGDVQKQLERLLLDETVACGWITERRFTDNGGWS